MADEIKEENQDQPEEQAVDTPEEETPETPAEENTDAPKEDEPKEEDQKPEDEEDKDDESDEDSDEEEEDQDEEGDSEYNEYEHPALKQAVNLLKEADVPVEVANEIFSEAVETGDLSKIDKKTLVEKVGQDKADVILVLAESYYTTQFSSMKAIKEEAFAVTGGEENFNAMTEWANEKASNDKEFAKDLEEFRAMLDSGQPRAIKAAVRELTDMWKEDPDTTITADLEVGDKPGSASGVEPLSRQEYINEVEKAHRNGTYEQVHKSLWARRKAGQKKGI